MKNILVIKLRYLGDVLLSTPVLTALRAGFPTARLTMAVNRGTEDMVKWNPVLNEVMVVERSGMAAQLRAFHQIRQRRFDCVIDLTDGDRSAFLTWLSGAPIRIGFNDEHRWRGRLYTTIVPLRSPGLHRVERDLAALAAWNVQSNAGAVVLHTSKEDDEAADRLLRQLGVMRAEGTLVKPLVMFHPAARYWFKAWPADRFALLADRLSEMYGCQILIGGTEADRTLVDAIVNQSTARPLSLAGRATVLEFASVLKHCRLFIGNDNGALHIAAAVGTPVVGLFGPSNPAEWGPRGGPADVIYKGMDCRPCFHPTCLRGEENCMKQITATEVIAAAEKWLSKATVHVHG